VDDHELSAKKTPRLLEPQSPLRDHASAASPSDMFLPADLDYEALHTPAYYTGGQMKPEACHIVAGQDRKPHNRLVMNRTLHSWFDGTPQMTPGRMPYLFVSLGPAAAVLDPRVPDRVFLPIRLYFSPLLRRDIVEFEIGNLISRRTIEGADVFPSRRIDSQTFEVFVGFLSGGKTPAVVQESVRRALSTRPRPDEVAEAPRTAAELDQSILDDGED